MKRFVSIILIVCSLFSTSGLFVFAQSPDTTADGTLQTNSFTINYDDGSYCIITVTESMTRSTKTGVKDYRYYNSSDVLLWKVIVTGTFTYNGTTSSCTSASHTVTISDNTWYVSSQSSYKSGNQAIADVTMKKKVLGIVTSTRSIELTLTCDKNGNLS